ncbi:heme/hemin ABC transporter substrate-binding protein [Terrihabitans sp. B22-R8]|uniref:heme/hemin ABC transporter substrate-binding protein n=1 Tax=Terrihabitans sp. B22-R8 TaxID=3425128 RepID=UPI00403D4BCA
MSAIAALAAMLACGPALSQPEAEPKRIVSIGGAVTEILYRLGLQDSIVAVDETSLYPPETASKSNVGYMRALSAEGVLATSPDLILMEDGAGPPEAVDLIMQSGAKIVRVPSGAVPDAVPLKIQTVAEAVGRATEGKAMSEEAERTLDALKRDLSAVKTPKKVIFIMSMVDGRPMAAGTGTAADAMIRLAGGENVLSGMQGYKTLSTEAAAALQPELVLMASHAAPTGGAAVLAQPALAETPAGRNGALVIMDGLYLLGFGPRTPAAARELAGKLYPDIAFSEIR